MMREPMRVVCIRTDRMGDMLLTMPAMAEIKRAFPSCHLAVVCASATAELLTRQSWVDEVFEWTPAAGPWKLARFLRKGRFDTAISFYPRAGAALAGLIAGIGKRIGTAYRWYSPLFSVRVRQRRSLNTRHESEYCMELTAELGVPIPEKVTPVRPFSEPELSGTWEPGLPKPYIVIHPGSGGSALNAGSGYYSKVARALGEEGLYVVLTGTERERTLMHEIARAAGIPVDRCVFPPNLAALARVMSEAAGVVGPATGPIHLAAVMGTPVAALYAPIHSQHPTRWGPLGRRVRVLTPRPAVCRKCDGPKCPLFNCLESIPPGDIVKTLRELAKG